MNKKSLFVLSIASTLLLAGCNTPSTSEQPSSTPNSSEVTPEETVTTTETTTESEKTSETTTESSETTSETTTESSESTSESTTEPAATYTKLSEVVTLAKGATFVSRGIYAGRCNKAATKGDATLYNAVYVADGETWFQLYSVDVALVDSLTLGSVIEFDGKMDIYNGLSEGKAVSTIKIVEDDSILAPVGLTLNAENAFDLTATMQNKKVSISGAVIDGVSKDNYGILTVTFKVGSKSYSLYLDNRYNDVTTGAIATLGAGDTASFDTYVTVNNDKVSFVYVDNLSVTKTEKVIVFTSGTSSIEVGKTLTLAAKNTLHADDTFTWTSSNTEVATVDNGVVTAIKEGEATITATSVTSPTLSDDFVVTVVAKQIEAEGKEVEFDFSNKTLITTDDPNKSVRTLGSVTITQEKGTSNNNVVNTYYQLRAYVGHVVTFATSSGKFSKIVFTITTTKSSSEEFASMFGSDVTAVATDATHVTLTCNANSVSFTPTKQVQLISAIFTIA